MVIYVDPIRCGLMSNFDTQACAAAGPPLTQPIGYRTVFKKFLFRSDCFVVQVPGLTSGYSLAGSGYVSKLMVQFLRLTLVSIHLGTALCHSSVLLY